MNEVTEKPTTSKARKPCIGSIEADIAFFNARLALVRHHPDTAYKKAQINMYHAMKKVLKVQLEELQIKQKLKQARKTQS